MRLNSLTMCIVGSLLALIMIACDDGGSSKTSVEELLPSTADGEALEVVVNENSQTGSMGFDVSGADTSDEAVEAFGEYLEDGTIEVTITSSDTGVNYNILEGTHVEGTPSAPGEYSFAVQNDALIVDFYNEYDGVSLDPTKEYFATVEVHANDYFEAGIYNVSLNLI